MRITIKYTPGQREYLRENPGCYKWKPYWLGIWVGRLYVGLCTQEWYPTGLIPFVSSNKYTKPEYEGHKTWIVWRWVKIRYLHHNPGGYMGDI